MNSILRHGWRGLLIALAMSLNQVNAAPPTPFPKADPAGTFPEQKIYQSPGQPWRIAVEDWEGARQRVASDSEWKQWLKNERQTVDDWMARYPTDRVEWRAGWWHDFVSPKDGSFLTWTNEIPGE